ncbi:MAG: hypothetical protein Q8R16_02740 [bacterium]|nr:hypothetical protein [bacterium]
MRFFVLADVAHATRVTLRVIANTIGAVIGVALGLGLTALGMLLSFAAMGWCITDGFKLLGPVLGWIVALIVWGVGSCWLASGMCVTPFFFGVMAPFVIGEYVARLATRRCSAAPS